MDSFVFYSPTKYLFGKGEEKRAGHCVRAFGGSRVLLLYGGGSAVRSGLLDRVRQSLEEEGIFCAALGGVSPNPKSGLVYEGIRLCQAEKLDFILAVGGGSVIDSAKAIGIGTLYDGDFWDFFTGKANAAETLPVGTVLTIAASGSEGSVCSVITHEDGNQKRLYGNDIMRPCFSVLNPELTQTLPPYQTACGIVDMMTHVLERYFTNTTEVEVTDRMCEGLLTAIIREGKKVMEQPDDYGARANLMWAGTLAHNNICGVGRQQDWASHNLEHELSSRYGCAHGAGLAVIYPAWMEYAMSHNVMRFAQLAVRVVLGCPMDFEHPQLTARAGLEALRAFWKSLGMPMCLEEIGGCRADIPALLDSLQIDGRTEGSFVKLDRKGCEAVYRLACRE